MAEIFISYKSERRAAARHLAKVLSAYGYDVWFDYGLLPGEDFEPRLLKELAEAKVVVVLWCSLSVNSDWVLREATEAHRKGAFLPVRIEHSRLPEDFARAHTLNITEWDGSSRSPRLDPLLEDIARRVGSAPAMDFRALREIDETWQDFGSPSLAEFALGKSMKPDEVEAGSAKLERPDPLGPPPDGLTPNLHEHWENARAGDMTSLSMVAGAFEDGSDGLPTDSDKACALLRIAAQAGNARGQCGLGFMYANGRGGVVPDEIEAVRRARLAADRGSAPGPGTLRARSAHRDWGRGRDA